MQSAQLVQAYAGYVLWVLHSNERGRLHLGCQRRWLSVRYPYRLKRLQLLLVGTTNLLRLLHSPQYDSNYGLVRASRWIQQTSALESCNSWQHLGSSNSTDLRWIVRLDDFPYSLHFSGLFPHPTSDGRAVWLQHRRWLKVLSLCVRCICYLLPSHLLLLSDAIFRPTCSRYVASNWREL